MNQDYIRAAVAVLAGSVVIFLGDILLGVKIEMFYGISTFTFLWTLDVFLVPYIGGLTVAFIYRERAGKWLAFLPPIIVRCLSCLYLYLTNDQWNADFFFHLNLHYWGLAVVLSFQASYLGGWLGGILTGSYLRNNDNVRNTSGRASNTNKTSANVKIHSQIGDNT